MGRGCKKYIREGQVVTSKMVAKAVGCDPSAALRRIQNRHYLEDIYAPKQGGEFFPKREYLREGVVLTVDEVMEKVGCSYDYARARIHHFKLLKDIFKPKPNGEKTYIREGVHITVRMVMKATGFDYRKAWWRIRRYDLLNDIYDIQHKNIYSRVMDDGKVWTSGEFAEHTGFSVSLAKLRLEGSGGSMEKATRPKQKYEKKKAAKVRVRGRARIEKKVSGAMKVFDPFNKMAKPVNWEAIV